MEKVVHVPSSEMPPQGQPVIQPISNNQPVMRKVNTTSPKSGMILAIVAILVVLAGVGTGWKLSGASVPGSSGGNEVDSTALIPGAVNNENEAGVETEACKDEAEGVLEEGGIDGEGTHHLVRSADVSKNVYLGSTVIDLQSFVGKKVKVTGQTMSGKKAGWLMDVCKIKSI